MDLPSSYVVRDAWSLCDNSTAFASGPSASMRAQTFSAITRSCDVDLRSISNRAA